VSVPQAAGPERSLGELSAHWVRANVDAAGAAFVLGLAAFGVRQMLGMPDPDAGVVAKAALVAAEVVVAATASAIYAARTGAVLVQKLPRFPLLTWSALHVLMGMVVGVAVAVAEMGARPAPYEAPAPTLVANIAIGGAVAGAFIGALVGSLQSLVLHKAAREIGTWISWSAVAGTTFGAYALVLYVGSDPTLANEILTQLVSFAIAVVGGAVMLPALHRLEPR
jgi:hypothetical protein